MLRTLTLSAALSATCATLFAQSHTGLVALTDLGIDEYAGYQGGLYPGGSNARPSDHDAAGLAIASDDIYPRDRKGNPDPVNGKVGFLTLGMSNTALESNAFINLVRHDGDIDPHLAVVSGAMGGATAYKWADPANQVWEQMFLKLKKADLAPKQVQYAWIKLANPTRAMASTAFPDHAVELHGQMKAILGILHASLPNLKIVYFSSRIYAGYATSPLNPEPIAYESGFAVKWLVEDQIDGDDVLNYSGPNANSPWIAWGPYLWADGLGTDDVQGGIGGRNDGLEWMREDFRDTDGTHPSELGSLKVARLLLDWLKAEPTCSRWFGATQDNADNSASGGRSAKSEQKAPTIPLAGSLPEIVGCAVCHSVGPSGIALPVLLFAIVAASVAASLRALRRRASLR